MPHFLFLSPVHNYYFETNCVVIVIQYHKNIVLCKRKTVVRGRVENNISVVKLHLAAPCHRCQLNAGAAFKNR